MKITHSVMELKCILATTMPKTIKFTSQAMADMILTSVSHTKLVKPGMQSSLFQLKLKSIG